ncbi:MAG: DUF2786 domain-containing protein [Thermodesulfobacteriota bacterium]
MAAPTTEETDPKLLQRAWLLQLYQEHERICWQHGVRLAVPIIEISSSSSNWGSWHPAGRTIRIAARLIQHHSWDVVINILKHEMAHQAVSELFDSHDAHGRRFAEACDLLGVPGEFRGASGDLPRTIPDAGAMACGSPHRSLLMKIEKLLALAGSGNEHEALLAMEKANYLIAKYNIRRIEQSREARYECLIINHQSRRIENYQRKICSILANHFFVRIILADLFDAAQCCTHKTIEILGTSENVLIANYVYSFLLAQLDSLWRQFQRSHRTSGRQKRSYFLGVLDGFARKLAGQQQEFPGSNHASGTTISLSLQVCSTDQGLNRFIEERHPRLSRRKFSSARVYLREYEAGCSDGGNLTLNKGVTGSDGFQGRMLPLRR